MADKKTTLAEENQYICERETAEERRVIHYYYHESEIKRLVGKVLTIVDSSIPDERQNKAMKDLIKERARDVLNDSQSYCFKSGTGHSIHIEEE